MGGILRQEPPVSGLDSGIGAIDRQPGGVKPRPANDEKVGKATRTLRQRELEKQVDDRD